MAKKTQIQIRLEYKNQIVGETDSASYSDNITIGRSHDCKWVIPKDDQVASGHHAVITMQNGKLCVRDTGSRNGIFFQGQRVPERILAPGDRVSVGDCILFVEAVKHSQRGDGVNSIQFMNGPNKGKILPIKTQKITIGSAPGSDIPLMDQLVSQRHAEITVKADGCWIRDLGSKNGTSVNGTLLKSDTERMLKDCDVITVSYIDMKFLDASVVHQQSHLWISLGVVIATLAIVFAGYYTYQQLNPSSSYYLKLARTSASKQNFDKARSYIADSRNLRGAAENEIQRNDLSRSVDLWENTIRNWGKAKNALANGRWIEASHMLGSIESGRMDIWGWNDTDAVKSRQEAANAKKLLDAYLSASAGLSEDLASCDALRAQKNMMSAAISSQPGTVPEYAAPLLKKSKELLASINKNLEDNIAIEKALAGLASKNIDYSTVISELQIIAKRTQGTIKARAEKVLLPIMRLKTADKSVEETVDKIMAMNFDEAEKLQLDLPSPEQCALDPNIATLRKKLSDTGNDLISMAKQLSFMYNELMKRGLKADYSTPDCLASFLNSGTMANVFACDTLERTMPPRSRTEPSGDYDRLLGVETFYNYMSTLPAPYDPNIFDEINFKPHILSLLNLSQQMDSFARYMNRDSSKIVKGGELNKLLTHVEDLLAKRNELVTELYSKQGITREAILSRGIALFLAPSDKMSEDAPEVFSTDLRKFRTPLIKMSNEYSTAVPERAIQIRDEILKKGIPGDAVVRKMWSTKTSK